MQSLLPSTAIENRYWQWRDQSIQYVHAECQHRPTLLLIHGFGASTDHWRKTIEGLQDQFDIWAIDLLGFGRSAKPNWTYSTDLWRDQIHDFIQDCIQKPVILVGNSLGGYVALNVASSYNNWVHGVALLNSAGRFTEANSEAIATPSWKMRLQQGIAGLLKQPWANFLLFQYLRQKRVIRQTLLKVYLDPTAVTDRLVDEIHRPSCDPGAAQVFASVFTTRQGENVDVLLQSIRCPLLILWGEGDPWMNAPQRSVLFRRHSTQLTEHFLKAGHCPHDEIPDQVNALLQDWVQQSVCAR